MRRLTRYLLLIVALLAAGRGYAQTVNLGAPQDVAAAAPMPARSGDVVTTSTCCSFGLPAWCNPFQDNNGPLLKGDPLLCGKLNGELVFVPSPRRPGLFASLEASVVSVHVNERMNAFVGPFQQASPPVLGGTGFHLAMADQGWTVSPIFRLGYRLDEAAGEFLFTYQYLTSSGTQTGVDASGNPASLSSHVNINSFDLAYGSREFSLGAWCDMKWLMGVRIANNFFNSEASNALVVQQSIVNNYVGAGPLVGLNLSKAVVGTGLDFFCRTECAFLFGPTSQTFNSGGGATLQQGHDNLVFVPKVDAGIGWTPPWAQRLHFAAGYTFQFWSNLAEFNTFANPGSLPTSRGDMIIQGGFFRAEWNY